MAKKSEFTSYATYILLNWLEYDKFTLLLVLGIKSRVLGKCLGCMDDLGCDPANQSNQSMVASSWMWWWVWWEFQTVMSAFRHHWGLPMVPTLCKSPLSRTLLHSRPIGNHHAYESILVASFPSQGRDNSVVCLSSTVWSSRPPTLGHFNAQILGHLRVRFGQNSQVNDPVPVSVEIILVSSFIWETRLGF